MSENLLQQLQYYLKWDPNEGTKCAVAKKFSALTPEGFNDSLFEELKLLLGKRLQFGTAGLRGNMGPGYNSMNDLVVLQTTQGLLQYLVEVDGRSNLENKGIVIGYDHRSQGTLSSKQFARMVAAVFIGKGIKVYLLEDFVPTPFVAFAVRYLQCAGGIMITASHNPKQDNGYKLYWSNGAQIIPPHDVGIAQAILSNLEPWQAYNYSDEAILTHRLATNVTSTIADAYFASISALCDRKAANGKCPLQIAYTAMHGVGAQWVEKALQVFGFPDSAIHWVASQRQPDPEFSTVRFPNPEEKGALDEVIKLANATSGCTLILANDPDADRLAVAEKLSSGDGWRVFTGNELGVMLGYWQIKRWKAVHNNSSSNSSVAGADSVFKLPASSAQTNSNKAAVLASVVSSRMLKAIAEKESLLYFDTLTGFKWLGNRSIELREQGVNVVFAFEEALGYCVGDVVCDKDGVSAAAVAAEMAASLAEEGLNLQDQLRFLQRTYGDFVSYNSYLLSYNSLTTAAIFQRLRHGGPTGGYWTSCAGSDVIFVKDITKGYDSTNPPEYKSLLPTTPDDMIMFEFANKVSVTLRTSGTEPKIKFYTEIASAVEGIDVKKFLQNFVDQLVEEMLQPTLNGLVRP